jgi:hypothetical protein
MSAPIGQIEWSEDLDVLCGYLSQVDGIGGALLLDQQGLPLAQGADSDEETGNLAPWLLQALLNSREFAQAHGMELPEEQLSFTSLRFQLCRRIGPSYLVTQGARGSYELFQGRIERCAQMMDQVLRQRRLAE